MNGDVTFTSTTDGAVAEYSCDIEFDLEPIDSRIRTCEFDGVEAKWSGTEPICKGIE